MTTQQAYLEAAIEWSEADAAYRARPCKETSERLEAADKALRAACRAIQD